MPDPTPRRIYLVAGEASGDAHGARLIDALAKQEPSLSFEGLGGMKMQAAGMRLDYDLAGEGIMGFVEVLKHAPRLTRLIKTTAAKLRANPPAALVLIDYPGFNIRLAKLLEGSGIPVIYYISPQVWAWKKGRIYTLAKVCRKMLVIFPFEEKLYQDVGLDVTFVGHPLVEHVAGMKEEVGELRSSRESMPHEVVPESHAQNVRMRQSSPKRIVAETHKSAPCLLDDALSDYWEDSPGARERRAAAWQTADSRTSERSLAKGLRLASSKEQAKLMLEHVVDSLSSSGAGSRIGVAYRSVEAEEAQLYSERAGVEIHTGFVHTLDSSALRHVMNRHGVNSIERPANESPMTRQDFLLVPEIVQLQHFIGVSWNKREQLVLVYQQRSGEHIVLVEEIRVGRKELALVTMYKRQARSKVMGEFSTTGERMLKAPALYVRDGRLRRFSPTETIPHSPAPGNTSHVIGLLPGSRAQEISRVFPPMLKLARALAKQRPGLRFVAPCVNNARADQIRKLAKDFPLDILVGGMHDVLSTARFCLVASGTATLETTVFGVPMIILYRVSPITYALARLLVDIKHIGMVNILAGREVVPEHVQSIRVPHILPQALSLIDDTPARQQMLHDLDAVRQMLGGGGASQRAAQEILAVLNNGTP